MPYYTAFNSLFFFNDTATTEIYTLSLHDALPISLAGLLWSKQYYNFDATRWLEEHGVDLFEPTRSTARNAEWTHMVNAHVIRSEEHTSELQSPCNLVCRLLLEKEKLKDHSLQYIR